MSFGRNENNSLAARILDSFPSGAYALTGPLRLVDIVASDTVPTAAVECCLQPRMFINPSFIDKHAESPEKLLMLVMHEVHHVLLGHTTLFPRATRIENFAFDAVINGILSRMFPQPEDTSFFTDFYSAGRFPECLLRPPPGWLGKPEPMDAALQALPKKLRSRVEYLHYALYSATGASYKEVYDVLPKLLVSDGQAGNGLNDIPLIGNHGSVPSQDGGLEKQSPLLFDIVRGLVEQWPQPPDPISGRSLNDILGPSLISPKHQLSNREILRRLICKVADPEGQGRKLAVSLSRRHGGANIQLAHFAQAKVFRDRSTGWHSTMKSRQEGKR